MPSIPYPPSHDFWNRMERTSEGCLVWTGQVDGKGYGIVKRAAISKSPLRTHRLAWFLAYGTWPKDCLMHTCDNPPCCEISHLVEGNRAANNADMTAKGRRAPMPTKQWCSRHPKTPANMKPNGRGKFTCRECSNERQRRAYHASH